MLFLLEKSLFATAFVSLFALPDLHQIKLVHVFLCLSVYFLLVVVLRKNVRFSRNELLFGALAILFYCSTMLGAVVSGVLSGLTFSQIFIITFIFVLLSAKVCSDYVNILLRGFVAGAIFTSVYMIVQAIYFYFFSVELNEILIPEMLISTTHTLRNLINIGGVVFYRATGLSWDPALTATGVVIAILLICEKIVHVKKCGKCVILLMVVATILSFSRVSIATLVIYLLFKISRIYSKRLCWHSSGKGVSMLSVMSFLSFLFFLYLGLFVKYTGSGTQRHFKYMASIFYFFEQNILEMLFGYGYRGVGLYFDKYVDWLTSVPGFVFGEGACPESTLINLFFWGGAVGSVFWIVTFIRTIWAGSLNIKTIMFMLIFILFGNTINSAWFLIVYFSLVWLAMDNLRSLQERSADA